MAFELFGRWGAILGPFLELAENYSHLSLEKYAPKFMRLMDICRILLLPDSLHLVVLGHAWMKDIDGKAALCVVIPTGNHPIILIILKVAYLKTFT